MSSKVVIGLTGTIGSGKDIIAKYLVDKHGFQMVGMGDTVREEADRQGLEKTREKDREKLIKEGSIKA